MISDFNYRDSDRSIYNKEFKNRIPDCIIDSHVHLWAKDNLNISKDEYKIYKEYKPWTDFDYMEEFLYEDYTYCANVTFEGKVVKPFVFGSPFPQIDRDRTNKYIIDVAKKQRIPFFYIPGQYENLFETNEKLQLMKTYGFLGLKPYPDIPVVQNREVGIYDMLNRSALEFADKNELYIILHLPRQKRLWSEDNRKELLECLSEYPNARFIIAHVGRAFTYYDAEGVIDFLFPYENVLFDTALINSETVLEYLVRNISPSRILFGSDAPLAYSRGKDVTINNKHYYVAEKTVPWGLGPIKKGCVNFTFYIYEEIRALLYATKAVFGNKEENALELIMCENAKKIMKNRGVI